MRGRLEPKMRYMFPGMSGLLASIAVPLALWSIKERKTSPGPKFTFHPKDGNFEMRLANYTRAVEFMLGLATGSVVLIAGSSALHNEGKIPWQFASPLALLAFCVIYGLLFMVLVINYYEEFLLLDNYTRGRYIAVNTLGFSALICFCAGYLWLVLAVGISLSK
jgi:hypothetical protein